MGFIKKLILKFFAFVLFLWGTSDLVYPQAYLITNVAGQRIAGYSGDGGPAINAHLYNPTAVYADNAGNIYISDWANSRLRMVNSNGIINTIAGNNTFGFSGDGGLATAAELNGPYGDFCRCGR